MAGGKKNGHAQHVGPRYRAYIYKGERDPAMDDVRSLALNQGVTNEQLHVMSGVSTTTFNNWWNPNAPQRTRRPTHVCLAAAAGALGYEYQLVKRRTIDVDQEIVAGQRFLERLKKKETG
jgi:hypothetical protein